MMEFELFVIAIVEMFVIVCIVSCILVRAYQKRGKGIQPWPPPPDDNRPPLSGYIELELYRYGVYIGNSQRLYRYVGFRQPEKGEYIMVYFNKYTLAERVESREDAIDSGIRPVFVVAETSK
jgi:hypothetical protein